MPHIVVADPIHPDGIDRLLKAPGVTLDHPGNPSPGTLAERLRHADGLIVRGTMVDRELVAFDLNIDRIGVASDVIRSLEDFDLVKLMQAIRGCQAGNPGSDDCDSHFLPASKKRSIRSLDIKQTTEGFQPHYRFQQSDTSMKS